ncbi:MAG TPA: nucleoside monophosphate kinase, partial [Coleofasciculaceae cyanobacterium]
RTAFQAEELDFLLEELEQQLNWAIYLEVPESVMMSRSLGRARPSKVTAQDTYSPGELRPDDQPEIVQRRIDRFHQRTVPILEYYGYRKRLLTIDGNQSPEQVQQDILQKLNV